MARETGAEAPTEGDMKQMLTTGKIALADMMGDAAILRAMKTNEDDTVAAYERASKPRGCRGGVEGLLREGPRRRAPPPRVDGEDRPGALTPGRRHRSMPARSPAGSADLAGLRRVWPRSASRKVHGGRALSPGARSPRSPAETIACRGFRLSSYEACCGALARRPWVPNRVWDATAAWSGCMCPTPPPPARGKALRLAGSGAAGKRGWCGVGTDRSGTPRRRGCGARSPLAPWRPELDSGPSETSGKPASAR